MFIALHVALGWRLARYSSRVAPTPPAYETHDGGTPSQSIARAAAAARGNGDGVVLARLILKERLTPLKATGMAAAIVAMPLIVLK